MNIPPSLRNMRTQAALALSAGSSMIYEVVATTALFFYFTKSTYSVAAVLAVFLFGLGIGSLLAHRIIDRVTDRAVLFGSLQVATALYGVLVLSHLLDIVPKLADIHVALASTVIFLLPTVFLGASFPVATALFRRDRHEVVGLAYASDLFGAIAGTLLSGFLLIPLWGNRATIYCAVVFNIVASFLVLPRTWKYLSAAALAITAASALLVIPIINADVPLYELNKLPAGYQFYQNSAYGPVAVQNDVLIINNRIQCTYTNTGSGDTDITELQMAKMAITPLPESSRHILNIGLGCAGTLGQAISEPGVQADIVEINPSVINANKKFNDILDDPRVNLIVDDGFHYLRTTDQSYDAILLDLEDPSVASSSELYTVEAFNAMKNAINANGVLSVWDYGGYTDNDPEYLDTIYYSLRESFRYIYHTQSIFFAANRTLPYDAYSPSTPKQLNTLDKNTLSQRFLDAQKHPL